MIELTSFYPLQNFPKVSEEYFEDRAILKAKSLSFEQDFDFEYKDVVQITGAFRSTYNQITFGFYLLLAVFNNYIYNHQTLLRIGQIAYWEKYYEPHACN